MLEFSKLIEERNRIMKALLLGEQVDFSALRNICEKFNGECVIENVFECDGTDQQLWESVTTYFQELLKE